MGKKTIVVLTKANKVQNDVQMEAKCKPGYETKIETRFLNFVRRTRQCFSRYNIASEISEAIAFIAAGYTNTRMLVYVSERLKIRPNGADYLAELWTTCLSRLKNSESYLAFMKATFTDGRYVLDPYEAAKYDEVMKMIQKQIEEEELKQFKAEEEIKKKIMQKEKKENDEIERRRQQRLQEEKEENDKREKEKQKLLRKEQEEENERERIRQQRLKEEKEENEKREREKHKQLKEENEKRERNATEIKRRKGGKRK